MTRSGRFPSSTQLLSAPAFKCLHNVRTRAPTPSRTDQSEDRNACDCAENSSNDAGAGTRDEAYRQTYNAAKNPALHDVTLFRKFSDRFAAEVRDVDCFCVANNDSEARKRESTPTLSPAPELRTVRPAPGQAFGDQRITDIDTIYRDSCKSPAVAIDAVSLQCDRFTGYPVVQYFDQAVGCPMRKGDFCLAAADVGVGFRRIEALQSDPFTVQTDRVPINDTSRIALGATFFNGKGLKRKRRNHDEGQDTEHEKMVLSSLWA